MVFLWTNHIQVTGRISLQQDKKSNVCIICGKVFITGYKCGLHYKSKHSYESKWTCPKCGKVLTSQSNLDSHVSSHSKFKCQFCNRVQEDKSAHKAHLKKHQRWLKAHESLKCKFCYRIPADRDGCLNHQKLCVENPDRKVTSLLPTC